MKPMKQIICFVLLFQKLAYRLNCCQVVILLPQKNLQMIVNKSRAQWHVSVSKLPLRTEDIEKIPTITEEIKAMLVSNPKIDAPYCYLSRVEGSRGELTIGCNIKSTVC